MSNIAVRFTHTATDAELLEQLDELVADATTGEGRAIGAIAIAFGPALLEAIGAELGDEHRQDAGDVLQDFLLSLAEARLTFPRIRGGALPWIKRTVRSIALDRRRQRSTDREEEG